MIDNESQIMNSKLDIEKAKSNRSILKGRKRVTKLPANFFETLLELEISIKKSFKIESLKELLYLYSVI